MSVVVIVIQLFYNFVLFLEKNQFGIPFVH